MKRVMLSVALVLAFGLGTLVPNCGGKPLTAQAQLPTPGIDVLASPYALDDVREAVFLIFSELQEIRAEGNRHAAEARARCQ